MSAMSTRQRDRAKAIEWAISMVSSPDAVVLDLETTALGSDAEIVDIAILSLDGTVVLESLIRPARPIPVESSLVHGITDAMVIDAPSFPAIYSMVAAQLVCRPVLIWNGAFDSAVIRHVCCAHKLPEIVMTWECAMKQYGAWEGTPGRRAGEYKWWRLGDAAAKFGIKPGTHRALSDAEATRQVILAMTMYCPLDVEDAYLSDGTCEVCGGEWLMGRHFHPDEIAQALTAAEPGACDALYEEHDRMRKRGEYA